MCAIMLFASQTTWRSGVISGSNNLLKEESFIILALCSLWSVTCGL